MGVCGHQGGRRRVHAAVARLAEVAGVHPPSGNSPCRRRGTGPDHIVWAESRPELSPNDGSGHGCFHPNRLRADRARAPLQRRPAPLPPWRAGGGQRRRACARPRRGPPASRERWRASTPSRPTTILTASTTSGCSPSRAGPACSRSNTPTGRCAARRQPEELTEACEHP